MEGPNLLKLKVLELIDIIYMKEKQVKAVFLREMQIFVEIIEFEAKRIEGLSSKQTCHPMFYNYFFSLFLKLCNNYAINFI